MTLEPWDRLGIAATTDETAIRRAYSRALKAIDVDADPASFIALREAFDAARWLAANAAQNTIDVEAESETMMRERPLEASVAKAPPRDRPQWQHDIEALQALIWSEASREAIFEEVGMRTRRLIDGPEMAEIDHATAIEQWIAETIVIGIPRTNGMIAPAIEAFGWADRAQRWDCPPILDAVMRRHRDNQFIAAVLDAHGAEQRAFDLLRDPGARPDRRQLTSVEAFLRRLRDYHPTIEAELSEEAVTAWEALAWQRYRAWPARTARRLRAFRASMISWYRILYLDRIWAVLWMLLLILFCLGAVVATYGVALLPIIGALTQSRDRRS